MRVRKSYIKYVAIVVGLTLIFQTLAVTSGDIIKNNSKGTNEMTGDDKRIVDEISNVTGMKVENIIKLKLKGKTWNEILETAKKGTGYNSADDLALRSRILLQTSLGAEEADKLKDDGFSEDEIMEAKTLVERVIFQLDELQQDDGIGAAPGISNRQTNQNEDAAGYNALLSKLELKKAVSAILKVKKKFNNIYEAMDEYLCALQLDLDIEEMLVDNSKYDEKKQEKLLTVDRLSIITVSSIETKLMDKLLTENIKETNEITEEQIVGQDNKPEILRNDMPQLPETEVPDVKPKDPAEELMNEINEITEKNMGTEGR